MPNTANQAFPYPPPTGVAPDVPYYMQQLAEAVDAKVTEALGVWQEWAPALAGFTLGNATVNARYKRVGDTVTGYCAITFGSTSTFSGTLLIDLPEPVRAGTVQGLPLGTTYFLDSSAGSQSRQVGAAIFDAADQCFFVAWSTPTSNKTVSSTVPWTWAAGDQLKFEFTYEAA